MVTNGWRLVPLAAMGLAAGCLSSSTYGTADLGGSSLVLSTASAPIDAAVAVDVTVRVQTSGHTPLVGREVHIAADRCVVTQAEVLTDTRGEVHARISSQTVGQHTVSAVLVLGALTVPVPVAAWLKFVAVGADGGVLPGSALNGYVVIVDAEGNVDTQFRGRVRFESSDPLASLPAPTALTATDGGVKTWLDAVVLRTAGLQTITVLDDATGHVLGVQQYRVTAGPAAAWRLSADTASCAAGSAVHLQISTVDAFGNRAAGPPGPPVFTSSDATAILPASTDSATLLATGASITLHRAGSQQVRITGGGLVEGAASLSVSAGPPSSLELFVPGEETAGLAFDLIFVVHDAFGNAVALPATLLHLESSDERAALPADSLVSTDAAGTGIVTPAVVFETAGVQTLALSTQLQPGPSGIASVTVRANLAVTLRLEAPTQVVAGDFVSLPVAAVDAYGNVATTYLGQVAFECSDVAAQLPGTYALTPADAGARLLSNAMILRTAGTQRLRAYDPAHTLAAAVAFVDTVAGPAAGLQIDAPSTAWAGRAIDAVVSARDSCGNLVSTYTGVVDLDASNASMVAHPSVTFGPSDAGTKSVSLQFLQFGAQSLSATDTATRFTAAAALEVRAITTLDAAMYHTCAVMNGQHVKCWGDNSDGQLGLGDTIPRGYAAGQMGAALPEIDVGLGRTVVDVSVGRRTTCALLDDKTVKCWGDNTDGILGQGDTQARGDEPGEMGDALPALDFGVGRTALAVSAGGTHHACALLDNHQVKCWGENVYGQLGQGDALARGDDPNEMGDALPAINLGSGRSARAVYAFGEGHTCVLLDDQSVRCWGNYEYDCLGYATACPGSQYRSDGCGNTPGQVGDAVPLTQLGAGRTALDVHGADFGMCVLLDTHVLMCFGDNSSGLHEGANVPGPVATYDSASWSGCAIADDGSMRCWGSGDSESLPEEPRLIDLGPGRSALRVAVGEAHACVVLDNQEVKCWGANGAGNLGIGDQLSRGTGAAVMAGAIPAVQLW